MVRSAIKTWSSSSSKASLNVEAAEPVRLTQAGMPPWVKFNEEQLAAGPIFRLPLSYTLNQELCPPHAGDPIGDTVDDWRVFAGTVVDADETECLSSRARKRQSFIDIGAMGANDAQVVQEQRLQQVRFRGIIAGGVGFEETPTP